MTVENWNGISPKELTTRLLAAGKPVAVSFFDPATKDGEKHSRDLAEAAAKVGEALRVCTCDPHSAPAVAEAFAIEYMPDILVFVGDEVRNRLHTFRDATAIERFLSASSARVKK
jgi:thioredoxin-like negative regulator of GroEL